MTVEALKRLKQELGFTNEEISAESGVPLGTVQKFFGGATGQPRRKTIEAIEKMLTRHLGESRTGGMMVRDPGAPYGERRAKEKYTIEDYYALPDDRRAELIDGVFYDMAAPLLIHQCVLGELYKQLDACITDHDMPCLVFMAPVDVRLDRDQWTMVQPDLVVICRKEQISGGKRVEGPPDLVMEILSPSSKRLDLKKKLLKYMEAGVREYWIIDPDQERVVVYYFEEDELPNMSGFDAFVPVRISGGLCAVDFNVVHRALDRLKQLQNL